MANLTEYAPRHYVHISLLADWADGQPNVLEPEMCESWDWYDLDDLPSPLFVAARLAIDAFETGKNYYDFTANGDKINK